MEDTKLDDEPLPGRKLREALAHLAPDFLRDELLRPERVGEGHVVFDRNGLPRRRAAQVNDSTLIKGQRAPSATMSPTAVTGFVAPVRATAVVS